ncbi:chorismate synthase [Thermogutta sp.]|uniref:chorismate synthase n=1 Tax=Thermogutta sp. TaxID=1962930 RepID=UPI003C7B63F6
MLRYWTAGESHGKGILALVDGFPAGISIDIGVINRELARRQGGYGRGGRQRIEKDEAEILSGTWRGITLGSPIAIWVPNRDYKIEKMEDLDRPRPGHGDLSGSIKYHSSIRGILERASARETVARVAAGALARQLLTALEIDVLGYVVQIGPVQLPPRTGTLAELRALRDVSELYSLSPEKDPEAKQLIDACQKRGDTLGGIVEVHVENLPFGLGTHAQWDRKLDGRLAAAVMAIQAIKGVEIGLGFEAARRFGSEVHDPILFDPARIHERCFGFVRPTNNAGGLEAGMTNGQPLVIRAAMKPISTLARPLESVNLRTKQPEQAAYERSDVCAISAASVIVENVVAFEIAAAVIEKFGGDHIEEIHQRMQLFEKMVRERLQLEKRVEAPDQ